MFYDRFISLCDQKGVSRTKACVDCGISRTAWHKWEDGATPNGATINKFATYFDVTVGSLLEEEQKNSPSEIELTEGEKKLIQLLRKFPEDRREFAVSMVLSALENMPVKEGN